MQLLLEEFFGKMYSLSEGKTSITLKIFVRLIYYLLMLGIFILAVYLILTKKYLIISIIIGLVILGEIAHYLRKSREKVAVNRKISDKKKVDEVLLKNKGKNKSLLKSTKAKNVVLLKSSRVKNKNLLDKKNIKAVKIKK